MGWSCLRKLCDFEREKTGWRLSFVNGGEDSSLVIDGIAVGANLLALCRCIF